jgi:hypothetical protein
MKRFRVALLFAVILTIAAVSMAAAQDPAYNTPFITSVTYQNVGTQQTNVQFDFYNEKSGTPITVVKPLPAGAGSSLFMGSVSSIPTNFSGSAVVSSSEPIVATLVQIPQSTTVKNRPLSNGFSSATSNVLIATVLKNKFNTHTKFSIQNADTSAIDITVKIYNADNPSDPPITLTETNIPVGAAKIYDLGSMAQLGTSFNGSATVTAVKTGTSTSANIVGSALELSVSGTAAKAFEGVAGGAKTVYMASALCDFAAGQNTAYAVQNIGTADTTVTVTYSNGNSEQALIKPGTKHSFQGCGAGNTSGFKGSATITSDTSDIVVIGKVYGAGLSTAFLGESSGSAKLALPYVRWTADANYGAGKLRQRTFIAIQNVGTSPVSGVVVKYLNKNGEVVGTHNLADIPAGEKANSTAKLATVASGHSQSELDEFGTPDANPGGGFGGAVVVEGPTGSQLVAVARVQTKLSDGSVVGEDYNGMPIQ